MMEQTDTATEQEITLHLPSDITIVIVEDDRGHYILTEKCLRQAGASNEIIWFEDGQAALDFFFDEGFNSHRPRCIVLLDIRLPKIDGTVVLKKMKADPKLESIPIIMLTTSEDRQIAAECYKLGCEAHVIKPPGKVLLRAIERLKDRM